MCVDLMTERGWRKKAAVVVYWLLDVPVTYKCISGTNLLRQLYLLPH